MHNAIAGWWNDSARAGDVTIPGKHFHSDAPWNATQPSLKPVYAHSNCDPVSPCSRSQVRSSAVIILSYIR